MHNSDKMTDQKSGESKLTETKLWYPRAVLYSPLKAGSIDGTDSEPHDKAIVRAMNAKYYPNNKIKGIAEHTIFIARLNKNITEDCLVDEFKKYGDIKRCRVVKDIVTGFSLGYAFIEFKTENQTYNAIKNSNGSYIAGKKIFVDFECERLLPGWIPRRLGGGFGGRKESGQLRFGGKDRVFAKPVYLMHEWEMQKQFKQIHHKSSRNQR